MQFLKTTTWLGENGPWLLMCYLFFYPVTVSMMKSTDKMNMRDVGI
jgi:hypothetical protein